MRLEVGQHIGNATVIERLPKKKGRGFPTLLKLQCDCGNMFITSAWKMSSGHTKSCGCLRKKTTSEMRYKHGQSYSNIYYVWRSMKNRCNNENDKQYSDYGGRGIKLCEEWDKNFRTFYFWAQENGYKEGLSIDRIDNNKGYFPDNCHWTDRETQNNNRRDNVFITYNGETKTVTQWSRVVGRPRRTIADRLKNGWSIEKALFEPSHRKCFG